MENMDTYISWFKRILEVALQLFFQQESSVVAIGEIEMPETEELANLVQAESISFDEAVVLMLALMPHISPQTLDIFFFQNKEYDRPYTEFGGWKGISHGGFLPTGETALFLLPAKGKGESGISHLFSREHWF